MAADVRLPLIALHIYLYTKIMTTVLRAQPEDAKKLHEIFVQAAKYKHNYSDYAWRDGFSFEGVVGMIERGETYAVYQEDMLVATVGLEWEDDAWDDTTEDNAGYIHRLAVGDDFHGQQLGPQIIDWAAEQVRQKSRKYLRLDCNVANRRLCAYYESQGFKQIRTKEFPDYNYTAALYQMPVN